jgi:hypothetical protein
MAAHAHPTATCVYLIKYIALILFFGPALVPAVPAAQSTHKLYPDFLPFCTFPFSKSSGIANNIKSTIHPNAAFILLDNLYHLP